MSLNEEMDPEGLVEHYQALSDKYIEEAKEFLKKGNLVQVLEKFWGLLFSMFAIADPHEPASTPYLE